MNECACGLPRDLAAFTLLAHLSHQTQAGQISRPRTAELALFPHAIQGAVVHYAS